MEHVCERRPGEAWPLRLLVEALQRVDVKPLPAPNGHFQSTSYASKELMHMN